MYQSSQFVTEDRQSWGSGRIIYTDYTAPSPTDLTKKLTNNPLCRGGGVLVSVVVAVLAAAACDSVVRVRAVTACPSLYPTTTTRRLCCFVRATLPGLFLVCC